MMRRSWLTVLGPIIFISSLAFSYNTGKIAGRIADQQTGAALVGVTVRIEGTMLGAATDIDGDYFIINVPPGVYTVTASMVGYASMSQTDVRVRIDQTTTLDFSLIESAVQMGDVVIVAERPKVERDLTASKEALSRNEIINSWGTNIQQVVQDIPGSNINGGIRGSFGLDVSYRLDGMDLREGGTSTNFASINLSTIQEVEVLTGGWNAEFGQANGSIVNVVTRRAQDRLHGIATYRIRPAGKYHWGRNFYGPEDPSLSIMSTPEFWDPAKTWTNPWTGETFSGITGGTPFFTSMTPEQRAQWWKDFATDPSINPQIEYANRTQWEQEVTLLGPLMEGLDFLASVRYQEGVTIRPSALKYNPDMTAQGVLNWSLSENTKVVASGLYTQFENSGAPRTNYQSSETVAGDVTGQQLPYLLDPYSNYRYWFYGAKGSSDPSMIRPPERARLFTGQIKATHVFDESTFLEVAVQHSQMSYNLDFRDIARTAWFPGFNGLTDSVPGYPTSLPIGIPFWNANWGLGGDVFRVWSDSRSYVLKADFTSQIHKNHLVKAGLLFSIQSFEKHTKEGSFSLGYFQVDDIVPAVHRPYEGAVYVQDKIELGGMVVNAGVRLDFFNANKTISADVFDPLMLSHITVGKPDSVIGRVGFDPNGSGPGYATTPTRVAVSPRLGISHPITETTVLHFMFGVFNQRPSWNKILTFPLTVTNQRASFDTFDSDLMFPETTLVTYRYFGQKGGNPALSWEKMVQYEIGFEQNIADVLSLDVTMYYKDAWDLTSIGIDQGPGSVNIQQSGGNVDVRLYGDPFNPNGTVVGTNIRDYNTTVNGAWADVRGIELKLRSRFRWINFDLNYTFSYLATGEYHNYRIFKDIPGRGQIQTNTYVGASNTDDGGVGLDDAQWNPHNSAIVKFEVVSPAEFGPGFGGFYPLGGWVVTSSTRWAKGREYTYYSPSYTGPEIPNNQVWEDRWNTNLSISKAVPLYGSLQAKFFVQVTNLFNNKHLRLMSGSSLTNFMEEGTLPFESSTREPAEWSWYSNLPRQIIIGTTIEF